MIHRPLVTGTRPQREGADGLYKSGLKSTASEGWRPEGHRTNIKSRALPIKSANSNTRRSPGNSGINSCASRKSELKSPSTWGETCKSSAKRAVKVESRSEGVVLANESATVSTRTVSWISINSWLSLGR